METMGLADENTFPDEGVLRSVLGSAFEVYEEFTGNIQADDYGLACIWRFYKDGKRWLCKVTHKKKTILWLSVYEGCFKVTFYFTDKSGAGIPDLDIDDAIRDGFSSVKPIGKLKPVTLTLNERGQLNDVYELIGYKKKCG